MPGALRLLLQQMPLSSGKVEFAWTAAVGPAVARATAVKLESGVLIVETTSAQWTAEIRRSSPMIVERLRSLLDEERDLIARGGAAAVALSSDNYEFTPEGVSRMPWIRIGLRRECLASSCARS